MIKDLGSKIEFLVTGYVVRVDPYCLAHGALGLAFKKSFPDIRNTKVIVDVKARLNGLKFIEAGVSVWRM